jgi:hypothetical protein
MRVVEWRVLDIPLSGSLLSCCCQYLFFIPWSGGSVATNLMIPSSANTCESINSSSLLLVVRLLLTLLQHPPKMRPTMLTGRTIAAIARGKVPVLATRLICLELLRYDGRSSDGLY